MNKLLLLIFILIITLISCDGRNRKHKTNVEVLKENKLLDSFSEQIKYIPEAYAEVFTDTILSNEFRVKIKTYTDMNTSVLQTFKTDAITHKLFFREFISEVFVYKKERLVFNEIINDDFYNKHIPEIINLKESVNNGLEINQERSLETNSIYLTTSNCIPRTVNCPGYNIIIDESGNFKIKKIDYVRT